MVTLPPGTWEYAQKRLEIKINNTYNDLKTEVTDDLTEYINEEKFDKKLELKNKQFLENRIECYKVERTLEIVRKMKEVRFDT